MVRLKEEGNLIAQNGRLFQFHYGTIKRTVKTGRTADRVHFNSTMVRLKVNGKPICLTCPYQFQFHYGTIKSSPMNGTKLYPLLFQFHYGTIKRMST